MALTAKAAVALVHYGEPGITRRCVESLAAQEGPLLRIVIADHGPGESLGTALAPGLRLSNLRILRRENLGFGSGCNAAAEAAFTAGAEWVWFLNNDATLASPVLSSLLELTQAFPRVGLWGTRQRDRDLLLGADELPQWFPTPPFATASLTGLPSGCTQLGARATLSGASILVSRDAWSRMGPWPEWCFLYWEDVAWCMKAHAAGIPVVMTSLEVAHLRNTTTGHHSPLTTYYGVRNSLLLHADCFPGRTRERMHQAFHLLQKRFFQGRWRMLGSTLRGILDARKGRRFRGR